jgi:hypothetical protein
MAKSSGKANPKGTRKVQAERGMFERVSTNWNEREVAIRRATRNMVKVDGKLFNSVYAAFISLGLPQGQHEPFRKALKIKKRLPFKLGNRTYQFEIV